MADKSKTVKSYQDMEVWQKAMDLVQEIYAMSHYFPDHEKFGLTSQIRRAAVSIPSNIAEANGRRHRGDHGHHLSMAHGSLKEVETQIIIAGRLGCVSKGQARPAWELAQTVGKMLNRLMASLQPSIPNPQSPIPSPQP